MSSTLRNERILKKLGIQTIDLLSSCLTSTSNSLGGQLRRSEFIVFWSQMGNQKDSTVYLVEILTRFITMCETSISTANPTTTQQQQLQQLQLQQQPSIESLLN